jgi:autotransporter translocation and assembly factor TamB
MLQRRVSPAKKYLMRTLRVIAFVGTVLIGIIALALIATQTSWFRNWLRNYIVRESKQYVNGNLSIGSLGGNLFYGVELGNVAIDVDGEHVITLKRVTIKYKLEELIASGMTVRQIRIEQPFVLLRHDASGWNVSRLVKRQQQEANRQGPRKPLSMPDIEIVDGRVAVDDRAPSPSYRLPKEIDALNVNAGYEYEPVHYSLTLNRVNFDAKGPGLTLQQLSGRIGERDDNLNIEKLTLQTPQSSVTIDGDVRSYISNPTLQLTVSAPKLSLPEFGGVLPALAGYPLHPSLNLKAEGPENALRLTIDEHSEAGDVQGTLTADASAPDYGARGDLNVRHLDLAPIVKSPSQRSDITGHAAIDLKMASRPANAPAMDRLHAHVVFSGPSVTAASYHATNVKVTADMAARKVNLDARANAYGGTATAKGFVTVPAAAGRPMPFDIAGSASHVNLADLPRSLNAPRLATNLNATSYHVSGSAGSRTNVSGTATLAQSTLAGGTILNGTTANFSIASAKGHLQTLTYGAHGAVRNVNLRRVGEAFQIAALSKSEYDSNVNAAFDVSGSGAAALDRRLDATATVTNSQILGGTLPRMAIDAHLDANALQARANGQFQNFDPSKVTGSAQYAGHVNGSIDATFGVANISGPMNADAITAHGRFGLVNSEVAGLKVDSANVQGQYANRRGTLQQASIKGPDLQLEASGPIALDSAGQSNLKYHVEATNLPELGKLFHQSLSGSATLDGTLSGNMSSLTTAGTLKGSDLGYQSDKVLDLDSKYTVTVPNLEMAHARIQAQTNGTFVQLGSFQINTLTATTTYADQTLNFQTHLAQSPSASGQLAEKEAGQKAGPAARSLDASGSVIFHPDHQEIHLPTLAIQTQGVQWKTAPGTAAAIQYGGNRIQVENLHLVNGNQSLSVDGSFSTGENPQIGGLTVQAKNVDIAQAEHLAMQNRGFAGTVNANATLTGSAKAPAVKGHVDITNGAFAQFKYQSFTLDGNYAGDRATIDAKLVQSPGVELTVNGSAPLSALKPNPPGVSGHVAPAPGEGIDLRVQSSKINLSVIQGFTDQLTNVTGTIQADVRVTGAGTDPHFTGYVDVENGGFGLVPAGVSFSGMSTRIDLQPDVVRVPRFQILDTHGSPLTIQGELAVHAAKAGAVNVTMQSKDFKLLDNELGKLTIDSNLRLTGSVHRPVVEGDVTLSAARLELDKILTQFASPYSTEALPDVVSAEDTTTTSNQGAVEATEDALAKGRQLEAEKAPAANATAPQTPAPQSGIGSALALNIHFVAPDDLVVRGNDVRPGGATAASIGNLNLTLGSNVRIQKQAGGPITLSGTARTVRGFYEFQGRRFTVDRDGTAQFHGSSQVNPTIDVTAERLVPNTGVTAKIHVTGTARTPHLQLSSDPPLDEADILSLILFNQNVNDLGTGQRASLAETAGGIASGFLAQSLGQSIGKSLDVDLFEITTSDPQTGENAGGVTLGKQVSDKAFVKFQQQFGNRSFTQFMLEYQLAKFLRLDTEVAPETSGVANRLTERRVERAGVDLIFFFSY